MVLIDKDVIDITNINRQIHANHQTIGQKKVEMMKERILTINPKLIVDTYMPQEIEKGEESIIDSSFSYIIDAVDTITTKLKVPILSCMGTGNKLDPTKFEITDIKKTSVCPLARVIRKELKGKGTKTLKVLYSKEEPIKNKEDHRVGSISFVPSVAGLMIAGEVIKDII